MSRIVGSSASSRAFAVFFSAFCLAGSAGAAEFQYSGFDWERDRAHTGSYEILELYEGRADVLKFGILASTTSPGTSEHYQTQGYQAATNLPAGSAFISADLFISEEMFQGGEDFYQSIGLWGAIGPAPETRKIFPQVQFHNGASPDPYKPITPGSGASTDYIGHIRISDNGTANNTTVSWATLTGPNADPNHATNPGTLINYGDWNTIRINYIAGEEVGSGRLEYLLNGTLIGVVDGYPFEAHEINPEVTGLFSIFLNHHTNGSTPYDVYWSQIRAGLFVAQSVPKEFSAGERHTGNLEIGSGGTLSGGTVDNPYKIEGDVSNDGGTLAGNFEIDGNFFNNGTVSPGNSPGIGSFVNYDAGTDGDMELEVDLASTTPAAGVTHDQIQVSGNVTGVTKVYLYEVNGSGPPTTPLAATGAVGDIDGVELITIGGTGGIENFSLGQRYLRNGWDVLLDERSVASSTVIGLALEVPDETYDLAAVPVSAIFAGDVLTGTYVDRRGLDWRNAKSAWGRGVLSSSTIATGNGNVELVVSGAQFGLDLVALGDTGAIAGVTAGFGSQSATVRRPGGDSAGSLTGSMPLVGGYVAYDSGAFFADFIAQYRFLDMSISAPQTAAIAVSGGSFDAIAEAGARLAVSESVSLVPSVQLAYQKTHVGDVSADPFFAAFTSSDALIGRARLLAEFNGGGAVKGFASGGISGDLLGPKSVNVSGLTLESTAGGARAEFAAGLDANLGGGFSLSASGEYRVSIGGGSSTVLGRAGVRKDF